MVGFRDLVGVGIGPVSKKVAVKFFATITKHPRKAILLYDDKKSFSYTLPKYYLNDLTSNMLCQ